MPTPPPSGAIPLRPLNDLSRHVPTLRVLRDRLSDLSMRNRSLRLARLAKSRAFDLAWLDQPADAGSLRVLEGLLSGRRAAVKLLDVGDDDPQSLALHKGLVYLDRDVRLVEQERGVYDLSVGFGFLCGNIAEGRYLQAPLFLLPRRLVLERRSRDGARWILQPVGEPDTVDVNRTLLLALQRFLDVTIDPDEMEEKARDLLFRGARAATWLETLSADLAGVLRERRMAVTPTSEVWGNKRATKGVPPLPVYRADDLPTTPVRRFELRPHAVVSRFPLADTALLKDYDELLGILAAHPTQPLGYAGALLGDPESIAALSRQAQRGAPSSPRWHVEPTDDSQEAILARAIAGQSLAVHGPPGTGKSQLIANLVATAAAQGKRILVVSQKRPALDVVAQRLGADLGRFVALVHDPVRDRGELCERILSGLTAAENGPLVVDDRERQRTLDTLERETAWFDGIHQALLRPGDGGCAYDAYVARVRYTGQPRLAVRSLPPTTTGELERELPLLDAYVADRHAARAPGTWLEGRPDWSRRDSDALEAFAEEDLPAMTKALADVLQWEATRPSGVPAIEEAARTAEAWRHLRDYAGRALALPPIGWRLLELLARAAPSVARFGRDPDLLAALVGAAPQSTDRDAAPWSVDRPDDLPALQAAAASHDAWEALARWVSPAASVDAQVWSWVPHLLAHGDADLRERLEYEARLLGCLPQLRAEANGQVVDPTSSEDVSLLLQSFEAGAAAWYSPILPSWYSLRSRVRAALGLAAEADNGEILRRIRLWRAARAYGEALTAAAQVRLLTWSGQDLRTLLASELEYAAATAVAAADLLAGWRALPTRARECNRNEVPQDVDGARHLLALARHRLEARGFLLEWGGAATKVLLAWAALPREAVQLAAGPVPLTPDGARALRSRAEHAMAAPNRVAALTSATNALTEWIGPEALAWVQAARTGRDPRLVASRARVEVVDRFTELADLDRRCRELEARAPGLMDLAWRAAKEGIQSVSGEIALAYAERRVRDAERAYERLREQNPAEERRRRAALHDAWQRLPRINRQILLATLARAASGIPARDTVELRRRAEQRRMRWSVRRMVEELWERGLAQLLPVWLCSPETVAAAFPLRAGMFDLVVFDEASQCTLAQGLTVAYRGRTVVVAGDEQQLPPSNLWNASLEDEDDLGDEVISEESLLSRARSAGSDLPLLWHYRSRFPQLIQYSNLTFYKGALKVSPVPVPLLQPPAVEWVRVAGSWDKRENAAEAALAVEFLERYLREHPTCSIGVITLNRQQSDRIEDLVLERGERSPTFRELWDRAMEREMDARPFIRNLENVQGDERDVIVLSVAYAADSSGRVPLRFGALTVSGGERRLNVAVSRARQKMIVMCSFDPESQLQTEDSRSEGARALRSYLLYAARGGEDAGSRQAAVPIHAQAVLAEDVAAELERKGWRSDLNVGGSAARVDVAVRSRTQPGRYVLAVVLDGPAAEWAGGAIGREIGRASYLGRYQWPVHALSARPWATAREAVIEDLVKRIEAEEARLNALTLPPTVHVPKGATPSASAGPATPRSTRVVSTSSARSAPPAPVRPSAAPEPVVKGAVRPGCTVRYRFVERDEERTAVITGPTVPRGIKAVPLDAPLALSLMDSTAGDRVWMELSGGNVEILVLEVSPPP